METKALSKTRFNRPSLFNKDSWLENFFNSPFDEYFNWGQVMNVPAVNVTETDANYGLSIAAPGLDKKDIKMEIADDMLTISAEKEEQEEKKNDKYNRREYNYTSWTRAFTLPGDGDAEKISAEYKNGELKINIPRNGATKAEKTKSITIS